LVVGSALIAVLALVALPGFAGSRAPSPEETVPEGAFQPLPVSANAARSATPVGPLDDAFVSAGAIPASHVFMEPGEAPKTGPTHRRTIDQPEPGFGTAQKPPKSTMTGAATFYDHGTTAMRLPRGTVVIICGAGGCIERTVTDYGPTRTDRIVDLYRADFFEICGCPSWSGTTTVTVSIY
jgi:hypothetical protein